MKIESSKPIAIVGGGLSGLATAAHLHLERPDLELRLYESASRVGGVIHTEHFGDLVIDHGADMFATNPPAALELCRQLGVEDRLIKPKESGRGAMIVHRGKLVPIPDGFVLMRPTKCLPMLTTPLLSIVGKLRLLAEPFRRRRRDVSDEGVADFVRRRLGNESLQRIVGPLVAGIYTADVERLSMQATMKPFVEMEQEFGSLARATLSRRRSGRDKVEQASSGARYEQFRAFPGGMIELIDTLANSLPEGTIRTSCPVKSLRQCGDGWMVCDDSNVEQLYSKIVLATPPRVSAKMVADFAPELTETLQEIEAASAAIVVMAVHRNQIRHPSKMFGFVVPPIEGRQILACSFASRKFAGRAPDDQVILRTFIGGVLQRDLLQKSDVELTQIAREELSELIGLSGEPSVTRVVRWNEAMPQYNVGASWSCCKNPERGIGSCKVCI